MTAQLESERISLPNTLDEINDYFHEQHWTDGLPIIPPTAERVLRMLTGTRRDPQEPLATLPPEHGTATVEKIAINAVMAGCLPGHMPVLLAAVEALAAPEFNLMGIQGTTNPVAPALIVNGPVRGRLGFNSTYGLFGPGNRSNASVGRAIRLILINIGGAVPGLKDMAVAGTPGKYSFCFAENEEENPWQPLHVERGFAAAESAVTVVGVSSTINFLGSREPDAWLSEAAGAGGFPGSNDYRFGGQPTFAINPLQAAGLAVTLTKHELKAALFERMKRPLHAFHAPAQLSPRADLAPITAASMIPPAREAGDLIIVVAGGSGAGAHSHVFPSFGNTRAVSRRVEDAP